MINPGLDVKVSEVPVSIGKPSEVKVLKVKPYVVGKVVLGAIIFSRPTPNDAPAGIYSDVKLVISIVFESILL